MSSSITYRSDIDGLRAVAVLAVIFFHFDVPGFSGGFTGVDIFFVISGYLIIKIILTEIREGRFSLIGFWERRVRRIIPALVVILLAITIASYYLLIIPADFSDFGSSLIAQSVFLSNWWFMSSSEYFAAPSDTIPLLHTWTLAVEEQFYVLFPLLVVGLYPWLRERFRWLMLGVAGLSFLLSMYLVNVDPTGRLAGVLPVITGEAANSTIGFYFIFSRLWEFVAGGLIAAFAFSIRGKVTAEVVSVIGATLIAVGVFALTPKSAFPGWAALLPVAGTALLIMAHTHHRTMISQVLSLPLVVWVGLLSYSLYLWHWPVLVLAKYQLYQDEILSGGTRFGLLLLILMLSALTYYLVEQPFRQRRLLLNRNWLFVIAGLSLVVIAGIGYQIKEQNGFPQRLSAGAQLVAVAMTDSNPRRAECLSQPIKEREDEPCLLGMQDKTQVDFVLWGDSHADAAMPAFDEYGRATKQTGRFFGVTSCPPLASGRSITESPNCQREIDRAVAYIQTHQPPQIFLVAEWKIGYPDSETGDILALTWLLKQTLSQLPTESEITVVRRLPTFANFSYRDLLLGVEEQKVELFFTLPRVHMADPLTEHNKQVSLAVEPFTNVATLDPIDAMCAGEQCVIGTPEGLYYQDSSHLSTYGARKVILPLLLEQ